MDNKETALFGRHISRNALMAPFAGWLMPVHYGSILDEAKFTRTSCSVFDICHMGEFVIRDNPGNPSFDKAVTHHVLKMKEKFCAYGFLLNDNGTVLDDLIVYKLSPDKWMAVVNAANIDRDAFEIKKRLYADAQFEDVSGKTAKLDVQGPKSLEVMKDFAGGGVKALRYFGFSSFDILGAECLVSRTGYTGELGFEIYIDADRAVDLWDALCAHPLVKPAGLGARDILRLEAGLPLYGDELTEDTTPLEADMERFIDFNKDFYGKEALAAQKLSGVQKKLAAVESDGRRTPRHFDKICVNGNECGFITSGVFSPHCGKGIGFGYVSPEFDVKGLPVKISGSHGEFDAFISKAPFIINTSLRYRED